MTVPLYGPEEDAVEDVERKRLPPRVAAAVEFAGDEVADGGTDRMEMRPFPETITSMSVSSSSLMVCAVSLGSRRAATRSDSDRAR